MPAMVPAIPVPAEMRGRRLGALCMTEFISVLGCP